nr:nucleotidyltransferase domain-containing protein [Kineosphaera limosa]
MPASPWLDEIVDRIDADLRVLTVLLTGSWAHGMATEHSDVDLIVVLSRDELSSRRFSHGVVDVHTVTLERLRHIPPEPGRWWDRYFYCRARPVLDHTDGHVPSLVTAWACLSPPEVFACIDFHLEGYLHYLYRSLKSHRESRARLARLDACESLPWALALAFGAHGRVRPINKYVAWELEHHPIEEPGWSAGEVMGLIEAILDTGDADAQRTLFGLIERKTRQLGFGGVIDSFAGVQTLRG